MRKWHRLVVIAVLITLILGCDGNKGPSGYVGPIGPPNTIYLDTTLGSQESLPGMLVSILEITGASGPGGNFLPGDILKVRFRLQTDNGRRIYIEEVDQAVIVVAGPSSHYQKILPTERDKYYFNDLKTKAVANPGSEPFSLDGTYTYTFSVPIPATYPGPIFDTKKFGLSQGELQGQSLEDGTYTMGLAAYKTYTIGNKTYIDAGETTQDFLLGSSVTSLTSRQVVKSENCNQCHSELRAHGGKYNTVKMCLLCHTAGAEDWNSTDTGDTTNVTIDFRRMVHKIHNGFHLPSVNGISTNTNGSRNYNATPVPYQIMDDQGVLHDYSSIQLPIWPDKIYPRMKDQGWSSLSPTQQAQEDKVRAGVTACDKCHGDPDGTGPLSGPTQGGNAYSNPSRTVCQSCHDDWDPDKPYVQNAFGGMAAQTDNSQCSVCHPSSGGGLSVQAVHRHPIYDTALNPGIHISIAGLSESGTNNGDATLDGGEKISLTFTIKDDGGTDIDPPTALDNFYVLINGPTANPNLLHYAKIPISALTGAQPYTLRVPQTVALEYLGDSTATGGEIFTTSLTPHWNLTGAQTIVYVRTASGTSTTLSASVPTGQNYIDVTSKAGLNNGDFIVLEDGVTGQEEYLQIQWVDTTRNRLWFGSPPSGSPVRKAHNSGTSVMQVTLTAQVVNTNYNLNTTGGTITELTEFGAGNAVVVSYTSDFVMPTTYSLTLNHSADLDESWGKWTGKTVEDGTYTLGLWADKAFSVIQYGETNSYMAASTAEERNFLVGNATAITTFEAISSGDNCNACHQDLIYHNGANRGYKGCVLCHGLAGVEDRALYNQTTPDPVNKATAGVSVDFRMLIHRIHRGQNLSQGANYKVIGEGDRIHTYEKIKFTSKREGEKNCIVCHGKSNTVWKGEVRTRDHSTQQTPSKIRVWRNVCSSCHDGSMAHIDLMTTSDGRESCGACHGPGSNKSLEFVHKTR